MPPIIRYKIRITSGEHAGRYLGAYFAGGLVTNPEAQDNPNVVARGQRYSLLASERGHTMFADNDEVTHIVADLQRQGYGAELIDTHDPNADTLDNRIEKAVGFYLRQDVMPGTNIAASTTTVFDLNGNALRKATPADIKKWNEIRNRMTQEEYERKEKDNPAKH
jgi:hypothetical protein